MAPGAEDRQWDACARPPTRPASPGSLCGCHGGRRQVGVAPFCQDVTPTAHLFAGEMERAAPR